MDTSKHTMSALFFQLGLGSDEHDIRAFIEELRPIPPEIKLTEAYCWNESQIAFLKEALQQDSDWCALVDELDSYLRESYS